MRRGTRCNPIFWGRMSVGSYGQLQSRQHSIHQDVIVVAAFDYNQGCGTTNS